MITVINEYTWGVRLFLKNDDHPCLFQGKKNFFLDYAPKGSFKKRTWDYSPNKYFTYNLL